MPPLGIKNGFPFSSNSSSVGSLRTSISDYVPPLFSASEISDLPADAWCRGFPPCTHSGCPPQRVDRMAGLMAQLLVLHEHGDFGNLGAAGCQRFSAYVIPTSILSTKRCVMMSRTPTTWAFPWSSGQVQTHYLPGTPPGRFTVRLVRWVTLNPRARAADLFSEVIHNGHVQGCQENPGHQRMGQIQVFRLPLDDFLRVTARQWCSLAQGRSHWWRRRTGCCSRGRGSHTRTSLNGLPILLLPPPVGPVCAPIIVLSQADGHDFKTALSYFSAEAGMGLDAVYDNDAVDLFWRICLCRPACRRADRRYFRFPWSPGRGRPWFLP